MAMQMSTKSIMPGFTPTRIPGLGCQILMSYTDELITRLIEGVLYVVRNGRCRFRYYTSPILPSVIHANKFNRRTANGERPLARQCQDRLGA